MTYRDVESIVRLVHVSSRRSAGSMWCWNGMSRV